MRFMFEYLLLNGDKNNQLNLLRSVIQGVLHRRSIPFINLHRLLVDPPLKHKHSSLIDSFHLKIRLT